MIHAVVFDLGEVLASPPSLLPELARRIGTTSAILDAHYWEGRVEYDGGAPDAEYWGPLLEAAGVEPSADLIAELARLDASCWSELRATARQLLRDVRATGVRVAVLSNSPRAMQVAAEAAPWRSDVDQLFVSSAIGLSKPDPAVYRHVEQRLGFSGREIAFIDDKPTNVAAALDLGWQGHVWTSDADTRVWLVGLGVL